MHVHAYITVHIIDWHSHSPVRALSTVRNVLLNSPLPLPVQTPHRYTPLSCCSALHMCRVRDTWTSVPASEDTFVAILVKKTLSAMTVCWQAVSSLSLASVEGIPVIIPCGRVQYTWLRLVSAAVLMTHGTCRVWPSCTVSSPLGSSTKDVSRNQSAGAQEEREMVERVEMVH